ncbi:MAG: hypothetical protein ACK4RV_10465 [Caulobacter sp.]
MTPARIAELRALVEAGTSGGDVDFEQTVNLLSTALTELPALLDEVERLRELVRPFAEAGALAAISGRPPGEHVDASAFALARQALEGGQ